MERSNGRMGEGCTSPNGVADSEATENINLEIKSEIDVIEIDDIIFLRQFEDPSKLAEDCTLRSSEDTLFGEAIVTDVIIKEEPVFYDPIHGREIEATELEQCVPNLKLAQRSMCSEQSRTPEKLPKTALDCFVCKQTMEDYLSLKIHFESHHTHEDKLKCQHCPLTYMSQKLFIRHEKCHRGQNPIPCDRCGRQFANEQRLKNHMQIHTNGKQFECFMCHKPFSHKISLTFHQRLHTGEKRYRCNQCGMRFRLQHDLYRHKKAHMFGMNLMEPTPRTGLALHPEAIKEHASEQLSKFRYYECYLCSFRTHRDKLRLHMKEMHTGEQLFKCDICSSKVLSKHSLGFHMTKHTENLHVCNICGRKFTRKDNLRNHLKTHRSPGGEQCKYCSKVFSTKYTLQTHLRIHTGFKPFECEYCKKTFIKKGYLTRHIRTHTGERPFACDKCKSTFTRNHHLTEHTRLVHKAFPVKSF